MLSLRSTTSSTFRTTYSSSHKETSRTWTWGSFFTIPTSTFRIGTGVARNLKQNEDAPDHDSEMVCLEKTLVDDRKFDGASRDYLRVRFAKWLESQVTEIIEDEEGKDICPRHPRYNRFLIVDEQRLQGITLPQSHQSIPQRCRRRQIGTEIQWKK
ncbi:hypothetical protein KCU91_g74, partial [Aureobasidium melanogenum]